MSFGSGGISIAADAMSFGGSAGSVATTGQVTLAQYTTGASIGIGTGTGTLRLVGSSLAAFSNYSSFRIGNSSSGSVTLGGPLSFSAPVTIETGAKSGNGIAEIAGASLTASAVTLYSDYGAPIALAGSIATTGSSYETLRIDAENYNQSGGNGAVTITGAVTGSGGGTIYSGTGGIALGDSASLSRSTWLNFRVYGGSGPISVGAGATLAAGTGGLSLDSGGGATKIGGRLSTQGGTINLSGAVTLTGAATISSSNGSIFLGGSIDSDAQGTPRDLNIDAGTGSITFSGGLGLTNAIENLSITGGGLALPSFSQKGALTINETVSALTINSALTGTSVTLMDTAAGGRNIILNAPVSGTGTGTTVVIDTLGYFVNNVSGTAINPGAGRWLIYTAGASGNILGTLTGGSIYGKTYASYPPDSVTQPGNQFIYGSGGLVTTIAANSYTRLYGGVNPTFGFVASGTGSYTGAPSLSTTATASSAVGLYTIVPSLGTLSGTNGTTFQFVNGTLTITPAPLTLSAANATKLYGAVNPSLSYSISGLVNGDASSIVTGVAETTSATASSGVGSYPIALSGGSAGPNYAIASYNSGALSITPAPLTLSAANATKLYGAVNPSLSYSISGLVNGDASSIVTGVAETTSATASSGVGSYPIALSGGSAGPNYSLVYKPGSLAVTPASLVLTANDQTRSYGSVLLPVSFSVSGLVNGDAASVVTGVAETTSATATSNVGSYPLRLSGGGGGPNYVISNYIDGNLSVTQAALTLSANNLSVVSGNPFPTLTYNISGLLNGDASDTVTGVKLTTNATSGSSPGTYLIMLSGGTSTNTNYYIAAEKPGYLTISQATNVSLATASILTTTSQTKQTSATNSSSLAAQNQQLISNAREVDQDTGSGASTAQDSTSPPATKAGTRTASSDADSSANHAVVTEDLTSNLGATGGTGGFGTIASSGKASTTPAGKLAQGPAAEAAVVVTNGVIKLPSRRPLNTPRVPGVADGFSSFGGDLEWLYD
jgi:hypothetical protein